MLNGEGSGKEHTGAWAHKELSFKAAREGIILRQVFGIQAGFAEDIMLSQQCSSLIEMTRQQPNPYLLKKFSSQA